MSRVFPGHHRYMLEIKTLKSKSKIQMKYKLFHLEQFVASEEVCRGLQNGGHGFGQLFMHCFTSGCVSICHKHVLHTDKHEHTEIKQT